MGFFDKMLGKTPQYPDLAGDSTAAKQLAAIKSNLEKLAHDVRDPMEVVPSNDGAYVFIGKPPKNFGIAWIEGDQIKSFKTLVEEHGMSTKDVAKLSDELREVYTRYHDTEHYHATIANRDVVVTPSKPLEDEVRNILTNLH
jgi:hypothetical protein